MTETVETTTKKIKRVSIRFSPTEIRLITLAAQREKISFNEYVRRAAVRRLEEEPNEYWDGKQWVEREKEIG